LAEPIERVEIDGSFFPGFFVWLRGRFFAPAAYVGWQRAQVRSRLAEGHRVAARSGLDGAEHAARLIGLGPLGSSNLP